uniref:Secreted protein n=1 Tax=Brugia malayi TaxID=6279 RepID=A0A912HH13_BRUMA
MRFLSYLLLVMMAEVVLTKLPEFTDPVIIVGVVWLVSLLHLRQYTTAQMLFLLKVKRIWVVTAKRHQAE